MVGEPEPGLLLQRLPLPGGEHQLRVLALLPAHQVPDQAVPLMLGKLQILTSGSMNYFPSEKICNIDATYNISARF